MKVKVTKISEFQVGDVTSIGRCVVYVMDDIAVFKDPDGNGGILDQLDLDESGGVDIEREEPVPTRWEGIVNTSDGGKAPYRVYCPAGVKPGKRVTVYIEGHEPKELPPLTESVRRFINHDANPRDHAEARELLRSLYP